jgi:short-subunit dehydrogenase
MKKSVLIIGAGPGLSRGVAERFAKEDFSISLISRSAANLDKLKNEMEADGIEVAYAVADAGNAAQLDSAIKTLSTRVFGFDVVLYNAAVVKAKDIMEETPADLAREFAINVSGAVQSIQSAYAGLKEKQGAFLLTGGGLSVNPMAAYGSLSLGKAGIRSLAVQLHNRLKDEGIYVGLLTIAGFINPESETHSPAVLADLFWNLYNDRTEVEFHQ